MYEVLYTSSCYISAYRYTLDNFDLRALHSTALVNKKRILYKICSSFAQVTGPVQGCQYRSIDYRQYFIADTFLVSVKVLPILLKKSMD